MEHMSVQDKANNVAIISIVITGLFILSSDDMS